MRASTKAQSGHIHIIGLLLILLLLAGLVGAVRQFGQVSELQERVGTLEHRLSQLEGKIEVLQRIK